MAEVLVTSTVPATKGRVEWVNALRGVAALSVLAVHYLVVFYTSQETAASLARRPALYHADEGAPRWSRWLAAVPFDLAAFGVGLFFLISGYVIAISLDRYSRRGFFVGRTLRILPTYAAGYLVTCLAVWSVSDPQGELRPTAVLAGMVPGLANLLGVAAPADGIVWTLIVEAIFYGVCLLTFRSLSRRWQAIAGAAVACVAVQVVLPRLAWLPSGPADHLRVLLLIAAPFIPVMLIGVAVSARARGRLSGPVVAGLVAFLTATHAALLWTNPVVRTPATYRATFVVTIAVFCLLAAHGHRFRPHPVAGFFADISYPLYVVHPVLGYVLLHALTSAGVRSPLAVAATVAVAVVSAWLLHRAVERPTHRLGTRWARKLSPDRGATSVPGR